MNVSMYEIYREKVYDLLLPKVKSEPIEPRSKNGKWFMDDLVVKQPLKPRDTNEVLNQVDDLLKTATRKRKTSATSMNSTSSRSHLFVELSIKVERRAATGGLQVHRGKLTIIDLAGSERIVTNNPQLNAESRSINMSLSYLSQVFLALSSESELIVYRNCTLTKLLANKLRRDTNTLLLATVSAKEGNAADTANTLKKAQTASRVRGRSGRTATD